MDRKSTPETPGPPGLIKQRTDLVAGGGVSIDGHRDRRTARMGRVPRHLHDGALVALRAGAAPARRPAHRRHGRRSGARGRRRLAGSDGRGCRRRGLRRGRCSRRPAAPGRGRRLRTPPATTPPRWPRPPQPSAGGGETRRARLSLTPVHYVAGHGRPGAGGLRGNGARAHPGHPFFLVANRLHLGGAGPCGRCADLRGVRRPTAPPGWPRARDRAGHRRGPGGVRGLAARRPGRTDRPACTATTTCSRSIPSPSGDLRPSNR